MKNYLLFFVFIFIQSFCIGQRNVVLIIADDLGTDYLGFYEDHVDTVSVPNIRSLLNKGVRFKNAYSNPVCSSTRAGILTGRYSFRTGVGNIVGGTGGSGQLDTSEISIPKLLRTFNPTISKADIGKWHLHQPNPIGNLLNPLAVGYNYFEGPFIGQLPSYTNWTKFTNGISSTVTNYATSENVNNAISWIQNQNNHPFFLWLAFNAPHEPLHLPPAGLHTYTNLSGALGDINANPKSYFKAMIQAMDHEIGRFMDSLQTMNRLDSTDFIFIGDNGNTRRTAQILNLDRAKGTVYEYGIHIPFIVSGPSVVNPNRSSTALVNTVDLFATILELFHHTNWQAQIPINRPVDSKSLLPIITNNQSNVRPWAFSEIFKLTPDSADGKSMRNESYKLIKFDYGQEEFYNLTLDPLEENNLLTSTLSSTDILSYNYLCSEIAILTGDNNLCSVIANTEVEQEQINLMVENPFENSIRILNKNKDDYFELFNNLGRIVYKGNTIELENFSYLSNGIYLLRIVNNTTKTVKLLKN